MQSIGEKLEEARKRQGISIREAAEATKIRADFLIDFENNRFDQEMPDIYRRGFVKMYAKFLKLDSEKMGADFNSVQLGRPMHGRQESSSLGSVEVDTYSHYASASDETESTNSSSDNSGDTTLYLKIAIALGLVFIFFAIVAIFISLISSLTESDEPSEQAQVAASSTANAAPSANNSSSANTRSSANTQETLKLVAIGNVARVIVRDASDRSKVYFTGSLSTGENIPIEAEGKLEISSTDTQNIYIQKGSRKITPRSTGIGKFFVE